jgi:hypothetical protein
MKPKLLFLVAVLLLAAGAGASNKAGAAPVNTPVVSRSAALDSALITPARWACWTVPGSGLGRQCRWVEPGWRREGPGSGSGPGIGPGTGPGPRCWIERIPGSGLGPQRVCQ